MRVKQGRGRGAESGERGAGRREEGGGRQRLEWRRAEEKGQK
jgi:hypothetical protein